MTLIEYLKLVYNTPTTEDPVWLYRSWYTLMLSILDIDPRRIDTIDKPLMGTMTDKGLLIVTPEGSHEYIDNTPPGNPILDLKTRYNIKDLYTGVIPSDAPKESTMGNIMMNNIIVNYPFKAIPFQYKHWTLSSFESQYVAPGMMDTKNQITVDEYTKYVESARFIAELDTLLIISSTEKTITGSPEIPKLRKKLVAENKDKLDDFTVIAKIENQIRAADDEYLKDDPTYGVFMSGKIKNIARKRMYGVFGAEPDQSNPGKAVFIEESLEEGIPPDPKKIVALYNGVRHGSYMRGTETQKGGVTAKNLLRMLNAFSVIKGDCGTKKTIQHTISKNDKNLLIGLHYVDGGKVRRLDTDTINKLDGKTVSMRTPLYCLQPGDHFCSVCAGDKLATKENQIATASMDTSHAVLTSALKAMHGTVLTTVDLDIHELVL